MRIFLDNVIEEGLDKGELYLVSTERNFELSIEYISKSGKKAQKTIGYYRTPIQALRRSLEMEIHKTTASTIHDLIKAIGSLEEKIDTQIFRVLEAAK